jgi:hypothetical protein
MHLRASLVVVLGMAAWLAPAAVGNAAESSLHLEGKGTFSFVAPCSSTTCPAVLTASLDGVPYGTTTFQMPLSVSPAADEFTGCRAAFSKGGKLNDGQYSFTFSGEFCEIMIKGLSYPPGFPPPTPLPPVTRLPRFQGYSLSGAIQIHVAGDVLCTGQDLSAAAGTLTVFGDLYGDKSVVSIVGTADSIPLCPRPSP